MEQAFTYLPTAVSAPLEVVDQHSQVLVQTPARQAEQRRKQVRCVGALLAVAGLGLALFHVGLLALIPLGIAIAVFGPARIRQDVVFRVLIEPEECLITPLATVITRSIVHIDGLYETSGWDARTRVVAFLTNGEECPLLEIPGTDETLAKAACEQLARLCRCAAEYTGPFGEIVSFKAHPG